MDLEQLLDRATDRGPAHPPVEHRLALGRRAARRRATVLVGGALGALALVGVVVPQLLPSDQLAVEPLTPAAIPTPTQPVHEAPSADGWADDEWARIDAQGKVTVREGASVVDRIESPIPDATSVALEVTRGDTRRYVLLVLDDAGISSAVDEDPWGRSLAQFASDAYDADLNLPVALHNRGAGSGTDLPLVGYDRGELYTVAGARIVRVVEAPDIPGWCEVFDTAGVELRYQGQTYFAVLGNGNCGGSFGARGGLSQSLEEAIAKFRSVQ